ncbi:ribonucleoside-triphosphate reductase class III catalytic subunit [Hallerella succinigenes]|uniref:Ribonucleoside-triphosphate reductase class III catalytic subunit n=1 Tax=Hallerella succinigenes TaxID=1896222 RepID=A0A2M9A5C4_9BACT|nr:anaerobic ribonucleoside-triphosphate reductase [Hallerella succinigenes]MBS7391533.1 anaerobic ribonucleoside-triphosphate reductase [Fibrobacter sp.]MDD6092431.1 anaerobic ribonucleoside-triphosphate reductase [Hallerella succinigenes]MDY5029710.1 anaerobic ribonucleoside-triphosphate reductase [Hallerella succinigenes]PJJ40914.1 ribonucleoside-triphosphate reductase class III catalytic subunit [Hallerella succinigenes]
MAIYDESLDGNMDIEAPQIYIMKRSGERVIFDGEKIANAIRKANKEEGILSDKLTEEQIAAIVNGIERDARNASRDLSVEEIQDKVENSLMATGKFNVARLYITYRYKHNELRKMSNIDQKISGIVERDNEEVKQENSNKNPTVLSVQRDYMAGEWSRYYTNRYLLSDDIVAAHKDGLIHFHDADYFAQHMHNCCLVNLGDMLDNGTCISGTHIDTPRSFNTACTVASQIVAQVASSQYGGQTITMSHLARYVDISRQKISQRLKAEFAEAGVDVDEEKLKKIVEDEVRREVESGCQTIQYQLITLQSTNGQAPFVTVFMYLHEVPEGQIRDDLALIIEVMLKQRILGVKDNRGFYITPAFPKLIYVLQDDNIEEGSKYFYLTKLAAECTAKRMVPDYISEKMALAMKGDCYPCMGCRSFLTPDRFTDAQKGNLGNAKNYVEGVHKYYGRFNQGVVTINLVDAACSSGGDEAKFWEIMKDRLNLCHRALRLRHERLLGTPSDVAPILWQDGALARLKPGEVIDRLLYDGYSTISLGYAGLAECVFYMKGVSHTSSAGDAFGLKVMQLLNDSCAQWKAEENIDYSVYGTPLESTTYKFAKALQKRFGKIPHVTDKNYITNSYHIHVTEEIDAFAKLSKEAEFQRLSPGGAISYVEVPNMQDNIPAVLAIMKHIYDTILYAELNTKSDLCDVCGYSGEIRVVKDSTGKLVWECPNCGNREQARMHVARRTCGYIGTQFWNQGRTAEIADRVLHIGLGEIQETGSVNPNASH